MMTLVLVLVSTSLVNARVDNKPDSLKVCAVVNDFYNWYLKVIKDKKYSDYQPQFVEDKDGRTSLDFSEYIKNLRNHCFSDSLIQREILSYQECIDNLKNIKYSDFKNKFTDLDDFERTKCDFTNYYRWIGGQEACDGIKIRKVQFKNDKNVVVTIEKFDFDPKEDKYYYWGSRTLTLKKIHNHWEIDDI